MLAGRSQYVSALRQELIARNSSYAALNRLPHVTSYGELPVVVYQQSECGRHHGNFISTSYRAILKKPQWRKRLQKVHTQGRSSLPARDGLWRELDSSLSSDALLMNIFCYPGVTRRNEICMILGIDPGSIPEFGFMPRVPLCSEATERTEIGMKLGHILFEAKLTELDFQIQRAELVGGYRDFRDVFESRRLPRSMRKYASYQLIRNVLAAHALNRDFCALLDGRRPDLLRLQLIGSNSHQFVIRHVFSFRCSGGSFAQLSTYQQEPQNLGKPAKHFVGPMIASLPAVDI